MHITLIVSLLSTLEFNLSSGRSFRENLCGVFLIFHLHRGLLHSNRLPSNRVHNLSYQLWFLRTNRSITQTSVTLVTSSQILMRVTISSLKSFTADVWSMEDLLSYKNSHRRLDNWQLTVWWSSLVQYDVPVLFSILECPAGLMVTVECREWRWHFPLFSTSLTIYSTPFKIATAHKVQNCSIQQYETFCHK